MELKPGYKQSEAGVIPEDWGTYSLGKLLNFQNGRGFQQSEWRRTGLPIIRIQNLNDADADFNFFDGNIQDKYLVRQGDLLFAWSGTIGTSFGPRIWQGETGVLNQHIFRVSKLSSELALSYALHLLESAATHIASQTHGFKSSFVHVKKRDLEKVVAALPPTVDEQERICEALKNFDSYLSAIESSIAKKRAIKLAAMQELLTGKRRLPGFEGEWEVKRLGDLAHIKTGSRNNEDKNEDGEYPFFVRSDNVERINSYSYDCEAILVPGEGRIGEIFHYVNGRFDVHQRVYAITQFKAGLSGKFVHSYMAMNFGAWAMQNTVKATVDSLRLPTFKSFEMLVPPTEDEQDAIADVLSDMDAELAALKARRDKARELKQGMMQVLLTGRIRLQ